LSQKNKNNGRTQDTLSQKNKNNGRTQDTNSKRRSGLEKSESSDKLSSRTRTILELVGKQLAVTIKITDREAGADSDGKWDSDTRTITLSLDTVNDSHKAIIKIFGHELFHAIKQMSELYPGCGRTVT
jgi:hypothetical protein